MKHIAANYIFDGSTFIRNGCLSFNDEGRLILIGAEDSGKEEKERMIFLNGIVCPYFDCKRLSGNHLPLQNFLLSLDVHFDTESVLPVILLENIDLQTLNFTTETTAKEIN